jgi:hypothetical protein
MDVIIRGFVIVAVYLLITSVIHARMGFRAVFAVDTIALLVLWIIVLRAIMRS